LQYSASEEGLQAARYHLVDEPAWHDISPLSDDDVHMLAGYAKRYSDEGTELQHLDEATLERVHERRKRLAKEKDAELSKPAHDPETTSTRVAKLQQKLVFTLSRLDDCHAQLRTCLRNSDIKATGKSESGHHQAPAPPARLGEPKQEEDKQEEDEEKAGSEAEGTPAKPIEFPKTTAQEDWDYEHHNKEPFPHRWRQRRDEPIVQEKKTAMQEYEEVQKHLDTFPHEPGYKLDHDRLFDESIHEMAVEGNKTRNMAEESLARTDKRLNTTMTTADATAVAAEQAVEGAQRKIAESNAVRLPSQEEKAIANAKLNLSKCQMDVHKCEKER